MKKFIRGTQKMKKKEGSIEIEGFFQIWFQFCISRLWFCVYNFFFLLKGSVMIWGETCEKFFYSLPRDMMC